MYVCSPTILLEASFSQNYYDNDDDVVVCVESCSCAGISFRCFSWGKRCTHIYETASMLLLFV